MACALQPSTNGHAEHDGLVLVGSRCVALGMLPEQFGNWRVAGPPIHRVEARQYAFDVTVENRVFFTARQGENGTGGRTTNARQRDNGIEIGRDATAMFLLDYPRWRPTHRCQRTTS